MHELLLSAGRKVCTEMLQTVFVSKIYIKQIFPGGYNNKNAYGFIGSQIMLLVKLSETVWVSILHPSSTRIIARTEKLWQQITRKLTEFRLDGKTMNQEMVYQPVSLRTLWFPYCKTSEWRLVDGWEVVSNGMGGWQLCNSVDFIGWRFKKSMASWASSPCGNASLHAIETSKDTLTMVCSFCCSSTAIKLSFPGGPPEAERFFRDALETCLSCFHFFHHLAPALSLKGRVGKLYIIKSLNQFQLNMTHGCCRQSEREM